LVVGGVLPLSGEHAVYGQSLRRGIEVASDQVNRVGGVSGRPLEVAFRDTRSSPQDAAERLKELIRREQVAAIIGGATSAEALAMAPLAESYHRVLLSPSASSPLLSDAGDYTFRVWPSDLFEASAVADFVAYTLHATRVLVISSENPYAEGIRSAFAERFSGPGRRVRTLVARGEGLNWEQFAAQARGEFGRAHCVYLVGYAHEVEGALGAIRRAGPNLPILTVSAAASADFAALGGDAEGLLFPRPQFEPTSQEEPGGRFVEAYRKRFGSEPDLYAAHGYDALMVLASVMNAQGARPESIQRGLLAIRNFPGASGPITFDAKGDVVQPIQMCVVRGGATLPLAQVQEEVLPPLQRKVEGLRFGR
jgi:branched-chain amino acid transport system substrate-binding protein